MTQPDNAGNREGIRVWSTAGRLVIAAIGAVLCMTTWLVLWSAFGFGAFVAAFIASLGGCFWALGLSAVYR